MTATSSPAEPPESTLAAVLTERMSLGTSGRWIADYSETPESLATAILAATPTAARTVTTRDGIVTPFNAQSEAEAAAYKSGWADALAEVRDEDGVLDGPSFGDYWISDLEDAARIAELEAALAAAEARLRAVEALADAARGTWFYACECGFQDYPPPEGHECIERALAWNLDPTEVRAALTPPQPAP